MDTLLSTIKPDHLDIKEQDYEQSPQNTTLQIKIETSGMDEEYQNTISNIAHSLIQR